MAYSHGRAPILSDTELCRLISQYRVPGTYPVQNVISYVGSADYKTATISQNGKQVPSRWTGSCLNPNLCEQHFRRLPRSGLRSRLCARRLSIFDSLEISKRPHLTEIEKVRVKHTPRFENIDRKSIPTPLLRDKVVVIEIETQWELPLYVSSFQRNVFLTLHRVQSAPCAFASLGGRSAFLFSLLRPDD